MNYQNLFDHLANQHNLILTEQEMMEIENIILESNIQRTNNEINCQEIVTNNDVIKCPLRIIMIFPNGKVITFDK